MSKLQRRLFLAGFFFSGSGAFADAAATFFRGSHLFAVFLFGVSIVVCACGIITSTLIHRSAQAKFLELEEWRQLHEAAIARYKAATSHMNEATGVIRSILERGQQ